MNRRMMIKIAIVAIIVAVVAVLYFTPLRQYMTRDHVRAAVEHLRGVWYAPFVLIVVYAISCVFATTLGLAPSNYVFAYSADALFNGTMTEGDALKRLFLVAALVLTVVLVPMILKKRMRSSTSS